MVKYYFSCNEWILWALSINYMGSKKSMWTREFNLNNLEPYPKRLAKSYVI